MVLFTNYVTDIIVIKDHFGILSLFIHNSVSGGLCDLVFYHNTETQLLIFAKLALNDKPIFPSCYLFKPKL